MAHRRTTAPSRWIWQRSAWPHFHWDLAKLAALLAKVRRAQGELAGVARLLDAQTDLTAQLEVLTLEGVKTSAIEGEMFDPGAIRSSIARRLGLPTAGLPRPTRSAEGLAEVLLDATQRHAKPLSLKRLTSWQAALFPTGRSGLHEIRVGKLRGSAPMRIVSGPLGRERVHYEAPPRTRLAAEMRTFIEWFNEPPASMDGMLRAGLAHMWFEIIHPFEDGNGRVGRAVLDMALAQDEQRATRLYSMSARFMDVRDDYYAELERASAGDLDVTRWLAWFLEQMTAGIQLSASVVEGVLMTARFWMRHSQNEFNERQLKALRRMLEAGPAGFEGGMTNQKYARLTRASPATAQRDLADLVAKGSLVAVGGGRGARYELAQSRR
jgi:Fic family protein